MHLKQGSAKVKKGDPVLAGDPIAEVGNSGYSWAPHLHVSVVDADGISLPYSFGNLSLVQGESGANGAGFLKKGWLVKGRE